MAKVLGRGLDALIPTRPDIAQSPDFRKEKTGVLQLNIEQIRQSRYQPRQFFDPQKIQELVCSIKEKGIIQPILVRPFSEAGYTGYELIAGERRLRAAKEAGLEKIPAIIKEVTDRDVFEISLIENIQRENLNPIEEAEAFKQLIEEFGLRQEDLSKQIGKDRTSIANSLRLLKLPDTIKQYIVSGEISAGHARAILRMESVAEQELLVRRIMKQQLTVREVEDVAKKVKNSRIKTRNGKYKIPEIIQVEENLQRVLGTKVEIKPSSIKKGKGRIEIIYYSQNDLERIVGLLKKAS